MTRSLFVLALLLLAVTSPVRAEEDTAGATAHFLDILTGERDEFALTVEVREGDSEVALTHLVRSGEEGFTLEVRAEGRVVVLARTVAETRLSLPEKGVVFVGRGEVPLAESLRPKGISFRILSPASRLRPWFGSLVLLRALDQVEPGAVLGLVQKLLSTDDEEVLLKGSMTPPELRIVVGETEVVLSMPPERAATSNLPVREIEIDRVELERAIFRAVCRAGEVVLPGRELERPRLREAAVPGGKLTSAGPLRLALLTGTPEEVGRAHGRLLKVEVRRSVDSTFHLAGLGYTIDKGEWFPDVLREAHRRLLPHIPKDHIAEIDAVADAAGIDRETMRLSNVFPELFHCSGFALFGAATADGSLYHGRVLDYMTMIGLQDVATVFVTRVKGKRAFVNVGYAGFIGSVTGMNEKELSLGEMGGRGEGDWDGVPMAMLMRRALEECDTAEEVLTLWRESPRTCEYYYVVADAKGPVAVGVKATPDALEVMGSGEDHPILGEGIPDTVVLSAGGRLEELRRRILAGHGTFTAESALHLMDRPVSMRSNLHNALFLPKALLLYVAHADHDHPAAERPYVKIDFGALLKSLGD
jgi:Acyl-coenzyme A:6-aminopenicillanic acid acyl-transferase